MKTTAYALIAAFLILAITPATTAERYGWSGYLGPHMSGIQQLPSGAYELPSWVHKDSVRCVVAARDYDNDGKYDRYIWGVEYTNPFTKKTICYVPTRGGGNNGKQTSSGASVSPPPPPPPPPDEETCETVETCTTEDVCAPAVCHEEREKVRVCNWQGREHHKRYVCSWEWTTHEECDEPVCEEVVSCSSEEVCSS